MKNNAKNPVVPAGQHALRRTLPDAVGAMPRLLLVDVSRPMRRLLVKMLKKSDEPKDFLKTFSLKKHIFKKLSLL